MGCVCEIYSHYAVCPYITMIFFPLLISNTWNADNTWNSLPFSMNSTEHVLKISATGFGLTTTAGSILTSHDLFPLRRVFSLPSSFSCLSKQAKIFSKVITVSIMLLA